MKKWLLILIFSLTLFNLNTPIFAENKKVITLKDGSVLNGKIIEFKDGTYTFETTNLGNINITEADVLSISEPGAASTSTQKIYNDEDEQKENLKLQVQQMQGTIMADQEITSEIQKMVEDGEIQELLKDPNLLTDVMSYDQNKIEQNNSVQELMNNPKMQDLINKIQQKFPTD